MLKHQIKSSLPAGVSIFCGLRGHLSAFKRSLIFQRNFNFSQKDKFPQGFKKFERKTLKTTDKQDTEQIKSETPKTTEDLENLNQNQFKATKINDEQSQQKDEDQLNRQHSQHNKDTNSSETNRNIDEENQKFQKKQNNKTDDSQYFENRNQSQNTKRQKPKQSFDKNKQKESDEQEDSNEEDQLYNKKEFTFKFSFHHIIYGAFFFYLFGDTIKSFFDLEASNEIHYEDFIKNYIQTRAVESIEIQRNLKNSIYSSVAVVKCGDGSIRKLKIKNLDIFLEKIERIQQEMFINPSPDTQNEQEETEVEIQEQSIDVKNSNPIQNQYIPIKFFYQADQIQAFEPLKFLFRAIIPMILLGIALKYKKQIQNFMSPDIFSQNKSNAKIFGIDKKVKTRFKDVAGLSEAKKEISEFVDFLKKPNKYKELGARLPRGALLAGPPGTGKTLLAKACAGEANVPFFYISGSDFVEMFVGVGASRVRDLFKQAKSKAPSIIFIDEIDAIGRKREGKISSNDEKDNTLNQLLVEMDGFNTDQQVVIVGATNRKDILDPALTRPGRFDRTIDVSLPDIHGRKEILHVHLQPIKLDPSKPVEDYAKRLATLTPGFSGADLSNLCNEAAIHAARKSKKHVDSQDFEIATEKVIGGLEKRRLTSKEERRKIAVHESGHAVVSWFLEGGIPLLKLTIIPRSKGSLGFAQYLPNESSLETREELMDRICVSLGGRVAEEIFFNEITTGAYDDLQKANELATAIVTKLGMSDIGYLGFPDTEFKKKFSDYSQNLIDQEILKIIERSTQKTRELVLKYKEQIQKLSDSLLEKETLDLKSIIEILGERPFPPKENYKQYLEAKRVLDQELENKQDVLNSSEDNVNDGGDEDPQAEQSGSQKEDQKEKEIKSNIDKLIGYQN